jgi:hypothetical protein
VHNTQSSRSRSLTSSVIVVVVVVVMAGIITQVSQTPVQANIQPPLLTRLSLDLRGKRFSVDRETIMNLPESVLLCLFPNGLVLTRQATLSDTGENSEEEGVYGVDVCRSTLLFPLIQRLNLASVAKPVHLFPPSQFDPDCFSFVLQFFRAASDVFYGTETSPGLYLAQQHLVDASPSSDFAPSQNPLLSKQAIIVLREELEYFSIPPKSGKASTDINGIANENMLELKRDCGKYLLEKRSIFTALQRNVNKENNIAEQHLIDMLCMR